MAACGFWQQCASAGSVSASQVQDLGFNPELKISWSFTANGKNVFFGWNKNTFLCSVFFSKTSHCP